MSTLLIYKMMFFTLICADMRKVTFHPQSHFLDYKISATVCDSQHFKLYLEFKYC